MNYFYVWVLALLLIECYRQRRSSTLGIGGRWSTNFSLTVLNGLISRFITPLLAVIVAAASELQDFGLLNLVAWPGWALFAAAIVLMDLGNYVEHRLLHAVPVLWRMHLVHHSDVDLDVTTFFRHHPFERIFAGAFGLISIALLGLSPEAVLAYSVAHGFVGALQHANIRVPAPLDRVFRRLLVTPDMHRIHHSSFQPETDSNYGTLFSFWDKWFGTYVETPRDGHEGMELGLGVFNEPRAQWCDQVLMQPFRWKKSARRATAEVKPVSSQIAG